MTTQVHCDLCKKEIPLSKSLVKEERVPLEKDGTLKEVLLTYFSCPSCGKRYVVIVDDDETLEALKAVREVLFKRLNYLRQKKPVPSKLQNRYLKLNRKLDYKRRELSKSIEGSFYQTEDGKEQLDYRYHARESMEI